MKLFKRFLSELKNATSTTYKKAALLVVIAVPLLYGALYLNAFWDPYSEMDQVPVAVVNLDSGYKDSNTSVNVGNDLVSTLKDNKNLDWKFMSKDEAQKCLDTKKCYASLTIPEDFSSDIYSVDSNSPTSTQLIYRSREATNYLATTITKSISEKVTEALSHKLIAKYLDNIFVTIKSTGSSLQTAADASYQLTSGLAVTSNGILSIQSGLSAANTGSIQIASGLQVLVNNQNSLTDGLTTAISGVDKLKNGVDTISDGLIKTQASVTASQTKTSDAIKQLSIYTSTGGTSGDLSAALTDLITVYCTNDAIVGTSDSDTIASIQKYCTEPSNEISSIILGSSLISSNLASLKTGLVSAKNGSIALANGSNELLSGTNDLANGLSELSAGTNTLYTGINTISNGSSQLSDSLESAAKTIASSTETDKVSSETEVMSSPVTMSEKSYDLVANYGSSFAPYFISLALWVGSLLAFFILDFNKNDTKSVAIAKYLMLSAIGIVQAIILDSVLQDVLKLSVANPWQFYAFTCLVSLSFMALLQLLIQHSGDVGRFIAVVLLILQLSSAAGTFPLETIPKFFQILNPFMPMTYSVMGLRDILFTNELNNLWGPVMCFVGVLIVSIIINLLLTRRHKRSAKKAI